MRDGRLLFPCGAAYPDADYDDWSKSVGKNGRVRLAVLDTANLERPKGPVLDGQRAPCVSRCPTKKYRKSQRAMSEGERPFALRWVISCSAVLERLP
jgi:hypothetical protein